MFLTVVNKNLKPQRNIEHIEITHRQIKATMIVRKSDSYRIRMPHFNSGPFLTLSTFAL
jgi:hypothetical protein